MLFPTPYTVTVEPYQAGATDSHGNQLNQWGAGRQEPVHGAGPGGTSEPREANRDAVTWDLDLLVPATFVCGYRDRVTWAGVVYEVEGRPEDYSAGPWWRDGPGAVVHLRRVEG